MPLTKFRSLLVLISLGRRRKTTPACQAIMGCTESVNRFMSLPSTAHPPGRERFGTISMPSPSALSGVLAACWPPPRSPRKCESRRGPTRIRDYALPILTKVIAEMLGVPADERHRFHRQSQAIVAATALVAHVRRTR
jgi:hypothetical protein